MPPDEDSEPSTSEHRPPANGAAERPPVQGALPGELDPRRPQHQRNRRSPKALTTVALGGQILAALLSFAVLMGSGLAWATYRNFSADIRRVNAIRSDTAAAKQNIDGSDQNILIVGNDDRDSATDAELAALGTTRDGGTYNTDTMMLLHVPADGSKATVISFPRDSYVAIPGHGMDKLNAAYPLGVRDGHGDKSRGAQLLVDTIENLTGLKLDHFVQVDLLGFYRISNAIGGVTVCLNGAMGPATYVGQTGDGYDSGYEPDGSFVRSYSGINLHKGLNVIQGSQALAFVRQRHGLPNGDLDRINRQHYFLSAVFRKVSSAGTLVNPFKLQKLLSAITSSLTMDDSSSGHAGLDPLKLAQQMQNLQAGSVRFTTIPTSGFATEDVGSVVVVNTAAMRDFINALIGSPAVTALQKAVAANPATVTVRVVNDTSTNGIEVRTAAALQRLGFTTTIPQPTSAVLDKTTIQYPAGQESAAKALQAAVPGAAVQQTSSVTTLTLALGNNGVRVKTLTRTTPAPAGGSGASSGSSAPGGTTVTNAAQNTCID
jgi:LCP family protein required for cell wall assembly